MLTRRFTSARIPAHDAPSLVEREYGVVANALHDLAVQEIGVRVHEFLAV
jgi:hypothetical protein